ncbi:MAG TPA: hypothetical protein VM366_01465 [Anaerolineae bacterium]|nr:hypothetical protein [Anaerolineae bacterium]
MIRHRPRRGPGHAALQMLRRAHHLMESGQFAQAYPLLRRLADVAVQRDMPVRAAHLYLRAAHARLEMGGPEDAFDLARRAIRLLLDAGQVARLGGLVPRMVEALEQKGYHPQAVALRAEARSLLGLSAEQPPVPSPGRLPTRCPSCSAPVRADEVTWVAGRSAECAYCGTALRTE